MFVLAAQAIPAFAQKQTTHVQQVWGAYFNQTRLSERWGLWADFHLRSREDFVYELSTSIARLGITYHVHDQLRFTAGYAFVNHFPADGHSDISQPEHRPWQQVQWTTPVKRSRVIQALRLEERFRRKIKDDDELADGYLFNYRVRHNMMVMIPLGWRTFERGALSAVLNNELMVNFGKEIVNNYYDQNRFFIGLGYHFDPNKNIQVGYMNVFQQLPQGNRYRSIHAPRVFFFHNVDLRKNKRK